MDGSESMKQNRRTSSRKKVADRLGTGLCSEKIWKIPMSMSYPVERPYDRLLDAFYFVISTTFQSIRVIGDSDIGFDSEFGVDFISKFGISNTERHRVSTQCFKGQSQRTLCRSERASSFIQIHRKIA